MVADERVVTYLNSLASENSPFLEKLEEEARSDFVPVVRKETQGLLKLLLAITCPREILEVGTAVGFSALLMEECNPVGCKVTTIESFPGRIPAARENFRRAGKQDVIELLEGDAAQVLGSLGGPYDFAFMDAAKGQYLGLLPEMDRLLRPGGILVSDNVLQGGDILESRFAIARRNRTIHKRMREYLYLLTHSDQWTTCVLPIGDGVAVSHKSRSAAGQDKDAGLPYGAGGWDAL